MKKTVGFFSAVILFAAITVLAIFGCMGTSVREAAPLRAERTFAAAQEGTNTPLVDGSYTNALYVNRSEQGIAAIAALADAFSYTGSVMGGDVDVTSMFSLNFGENDDGSDTMITIVSLSALNDLSTDEFEVVFHGDETDGFALINQESFYPYYTTTGYTVYYPEDEVYGPYAPGWGDCVAEDGQLFVWNMTSVPVHGEVSVDIYGEAITKEMIDAVFSTTPFGSAEVVTPAASTPLENGEEIDALYLNRSEAGVAAIQAIADAFSYTGTMDEENLELTNAIQLFIGNDILMIVPFDALNELSGHEFNFTYDDEDGFVLLNAEGMWSYYASAAYSISGAVSASYEAGWSDLVAADGRTGSVYGEVWIEIYGEAITKEMIDAVFSSTPFGQQG